MTTIQYKLKEKIVLPFSIIKKLRVLQEDRLSYKVIDKDTVEVKAQRDKDIQKDPMLKTICNPDSTKLKITTRYLNKLRDELWAH